MILYDHFKFTLHIGRPTLFFPTGYRSSNVHKRTSRNALTVNGTDFECWPNQHPHSALRVTASDPGRCYISRLGVWQVKLTTFETPWELFPVTVLEFAEFFSFWILLTFLKNFLTLRVIIAISSTSRSELSSSMTFSAIPWSFLISSSYWEFLLKS